MRINRDGYGPDGRRMYFLDLGGGDTPAAPDYTPMANASKESAQIMADQGDRVLAESQRQYDKNMAVAQPVAEAQQRIMDETARQGKDYYDYNVDTFRPLERGMVAAATNEGSDARLEEAAGTAMADARAGQTRQLNTAIRTGMRYGYSPAKLATMAGSMAGANASAVAGAATGARNTQRSIGWARQMDAAGLGRNLPGSSTGAYSVATGAGNSAVGNTMAPGNALIGGMTSAANITGQGRGMLQSGLNGILNSQTSNYNSGMAANASNAGGFGQMLGTVAGLGMKYYTGGVA